MNSDPTSFLPLFPRPTHEHLLKAASTPLVIPHTHAGITVDSTAALQSILADNHKKWHIFFNDMGFHNHTAHAAITLWTLGADAKILESSYKENSAYQRPAFASPTTITKDNWKDHLGDESYYQGYLAFFTHELIDSGKSEANVLDEYIFSADANFDGKTHPQMLTRFCDGLLHPLIHTGFGTEFGLPGIFAEGLAQAAVHPGKQNGFIPSLWFISESAKSLPGAEQSLLSRFADVVGLSSSPSSSTAPFAPTDSKQQMPIHALSVVARVIADEALKFPFSLEAITIDSPDPMVYAAVSHMLGDIISKHVDAWLGDIDEEMELESKVPELLWANALLYAVGGAVSADAHDDKGGFKADFFLMHLVTSSIFVSSLFVTLHENRKAQIALLKSYFSVSLGWYVAVGRPQVSPEALKAFFTDASSAQIKPPGPLPTPAAGAHPSPEHPAAVTPNPWAAITQSALVHPDDHLPKLVRALTEYAARWGMTPAGYFRGPTDKTNTAKDSSTQETELVGAEFIDGTLFVRAAGLTMSRLGWVREGQELGAWDRLLGGGRVTMEGPTDKYGNKIVITRRELM